jgi:pyruvate-formate lyase
VSANQPIRFTRRERGRLICTLCHDEHGQHYATCPLVALDAEIRNLTAHVGMCVANIKDSLERIGRLLRDEEARES